MLEMYDKSAMKRRTVQINGQTDSSREERASIMMHERGALQHHVDENIQRVHDFVKADYIELLD